MKFKSSNIIKSIFTAFGLSIIGFFLTHYISEELFIHQIKTEIVLKFNAEHEMDLVIHYNIVSEVSGDQRSTHTFPAGEQYLNLGLPRDFEIEMIYFMTKPRDAKIEISEISFHSSLASNSWSKDALLEVIEPFNRQTSGKETITLTEDKKLQFILSDAVPYGIINSRFLNVMYMSIRKALFYISLFTSLSIFIFSFYSLLKSGILENISNYSLGFGFTFLVVITVPFFSQKDHSSLEKRALAKFPELNQLIWNIPMKYTNYFNDHFPYRSQLSGINNLIKIGMLNTSPMPDHVRIGKEGWLFDYLEEIRNSYLGIVLYTEEELARIKFNLEEKEEWLASQGSNFYFLLLPIKHDMYPEYLPSSMVSRSPFNKRTQVLNYLKKNSHIKLIDGYEVMSKKKDSVRLFYKTDSHWNQLGAFYTYVELMKKIKIDFPDLVPQTIDKYSVEQKFGDYSGDLLGVMNTDTFFSRDPYYLRLKKDVAATMYPFRPLFPEENDYTYFVNEKETEIRFLIFRDSFCSYLVPYLSETFSYTGFSWYSSIIPNRVLDVEPDIVVHEMTQISLDLLLEDNPEIMKQKELLD